MSWIEVLVEGLSDVPVLREVLQRRFGLIERVHFRIHPHQGRGQMRDQVAAAEIRQHPHWHDKSLLNQLPRKLRGYGKSLSKHAWVLVVIDADDTPWEVLLQYLHEQVNAISEKRPRVLFRIAIEEMESWLIADTAAVKAAYPNADLGLLKKIKPDTICGAWEKLQAAIGDSRKNKTEWAQAIAPHLNLDKPRSPSFRKLIQGIEHELQHKVRR